ncbi:DinB family protein [Kitasatospora purpeofusca]|uniref:DinB family protein n=1 Tax=Kitasatospora purpeofusca TaxID=67352 RepID=UPI0036E2CB3D
MTETKTDADTNAGTGADTETDAGTGATAPGTSSGPEAFKKDLRTYLQDARDALLWKLEGLSEYDVRRPLTPTGTNLLGLVKHATAAEALYFGETFGRPVEAPKPWITGDAEPNADFWATPEESRELIVGQYRAACAHADETIAALPLDALGRVPWGDRSAVTLHHSLVHMTAETQRHAGHADIVRELVDGATGQRRDGENTAPGDRAWWAAHRARVEQAARTAAASAAADGVAADGAAGHL